MTQYDLFGGAEEDRVATYLCGLLAISIQAAFSLLDTAPTVEMPGVVIFSGLDIHVKLFCFLADFFDETAFGGVAK
jgi:hypothetical protein